MKNAIILTEENFNKLKIKFKENQGKTLIFNSYDDELNRKVMEKLPLNIILINLSKRKDFQKQRNSGFNQVMAKIAKKNNIRVGINFDEIIESKTPKEKSEILARIKQNIFLCKKNKLNMDFIIQNSDNERNICDLKSLGLILGMDTLMVKNF